MNSCLLFLQTRQNIPKYIDIMYSVDALVPEGMCSIGIQIATGKSSCLLQTSRRACPRWSWWQGNVQGEDTLDWGGCNYDSKEAAARQTTPQRKYNNTGTGLDSHLGMSDWAWYWRIQVTSWSLTLWKRGEMFQSSFRRQFVIGWLLSC